MKKLQFLPNNLLYLGNSSRLGHSMECCSVILSNGDVASYLE